MKFSLLSQRSLHLFCLLPFLCHEVAANTEIINFSSSRERTVDLPLDVVGNWSKLHPSDKERRWTLEPAALHTPLHQVCEQNDNAVAPHPPFSCPHELWLFLDLDDDKWASYSTFTLRLSWPASTPADFTIAMYTPQDLLARLSERDLISTTSPGRARRERKTHASAFPHTSSILRHTPTTRSRYARIRAVDAGVPTPGLRSHPHLHLHQPQPQPQPPLSIPLAPQPLPRVSIAIASPSPHPGSDDAPARVAIDDEQGKKSSVPFIVILEPLCLGVLPATLLPTLGFLIPIVLAAALSVPYMIAYLEPFIRQAREDLNTRTRRTNKER